MLTNLISLTLECVIMIAIVRQEVNLKGHLLSRTVLMALCTLSIASRQLANQGVRLAELTDPEVQCWLWSICALTVTTGSI